MKNIIIGIVALLLIGIGGYFFYKNYSGDSGAVTGPAATTDSPKPSDTKPAPIPPVAKPIDKTQSVIGRSVESREIVAYHYGVGETELLFVGGIHGGYEWNTALVAYEMMDYLKANPNIVPKNLKVTVIPVLNPDGLFKVVGTAGRFTQADVSPSQATVVSGRFNANTVDLNRNFDCDWQSVGTWQNKKVSGGSTAFSEPESLAVKNYVETNKLQAVVVFYSSVGGVFASNCHNGVLPETRTLTNVYAKASGYPAYESFDYYEITGDMVNWLAKNNIPAISVLLTNHTDTEWVKNKAGIEALFTHYSK
ncbi:MAG: M14 family zinc carboxypeptidase [bacterium]|nr:M14 family zinc carboxypeptidase [bacterium]